MLDVTCLALLLLDVTCLALLSLLQPCTAEVEGAEHGFPRVWAPKPERVLLGFSGTVLVLSWVWAPKPEWVLLGLLHLSLAQHANDTGCGKGLTAIINSELRRAICKA